jgi:aspartate/methionine/tyrosine aminotransferase
MTGDCVGFVVGEERLVEAFKKIQNRRSKNTPAYIQDLAAKALLSNSYNDYMVDQYRQKRDILIPALRKIGLEVLEPQTAFYLWHKMPAGKTGLEFAQELLNLGIIVTPGEFLAQEVEGLGNPGKNYVRFALVPTLEEVAKAAKKITSLS